MDTQVGTGHQVGTGQSRPRCWIRVSEEFCPLKKSGRSMDASLFMDTQLDPGSGPSPGETGLSCRIF